MLYQVKQVKNLANQSSASLSEHVLSELRGIRAEVATLKQEVYHKKSAGAKASGKTSAYKKMRRGCKACHDSGNKVSLTLRQARILSP